MKKSLLSIALVSAILVGCGGGGGSKSSSSNTPDIDKSAPTVNQKPIADFGTDRSTVTGTTIQLDASASSDPDGDLITYKWQVVGTPKDADYSLSQENSVNPSFVANTAGTYRIALTVNDGKIDSDTSFVDITVQNATANAKPQAILHSWWFENVKIGDQVLLVSESTDPDGDRLTTQWTIKKKPSGSQAKPEKNELNLNEQYLLFHPDVEGEYVLHLKVTDTYGQTDELEVSIHAFAGNVPPVAKISDEPNKTTVYQTIHISGFESSDYEKSSLKYKWNLISQPSGSAPQLLTLDEFTTTGILSFTPDKEGEYVVELVVTDGKAESKPVRKTITVDNLGLVLSKIEPNGDPGATYSWPYKETSSKTINYQCAYDYCDQWVTDLGGFYLNATDRDYSISDIKCTTESKIQSEYGPQIRNCRFGFDRDMEGTYRISRLANPKSFPIYMQALADRNEEIEYTFSFRVVETGQTFEYKTKVKTTYKP